MPILSPTTKAIDSAAVIPTRNRYSPFTRDLYCEITAFGGAGILYGVNLLSRNDARYIRYDVPTGWAQTILETDLPILNDGFIEAGGALDRSETLSVVVLVNGNPIERVAKGTVPGAGQFRLYDNATVATLQFGTNYAAGTVIQVYLIGSLAAAATGVTNITDGSGALVSGFPQVVKSMDVVFAKTAPVIMRGIDG